MEMQADLPTTIPRFRVNSGRARDGQSRLPKRRGNWNQWEELQRRGLFEMGETCDGILHNGNVTTGVKLRVRESNLALMQVRVRGMERIERWTASVPN